MGIYDDDDIEFDFFDEPETAEATQRRRLPRLEMPVGRGGARNGERPPRPPFRAPAGVAPLARLVALVVIAIAVVVGLVFWVGSCGGPSKHDEYSGYTDKVRAIADADRRRGQQLEATLTQSAPKPADVEASLRRYARQEQQAYMQAQQIRAPGPLRSYHQNMVDAVELRAKGLVGLADTLARADVKGHQAATAAELTQQARQLTASDVVWQQLFQVPATQQLVTQNVKGVVVPSSQFVTTPDLVSSRSFTDFLGRLGGTSGGGGGSASGLHGDGITSVTVTPQGAALSTTTPTVVKVSSDLAFVVTVENQGDFQEASVPVTLTITAGTKQIVSKTKKIPLIASKARADVTFTGFDVPPSAFNTKPVVKVVVGKVPGEKYLANNSASYPIFFTLS